MPKFACKCGETLGFGDIPNPIEWLFISDSDFDAISGLVDSESLYCKMNSFLECPSCKRLWIFWNGFDADPLEYVLQKNEQS
ncbi:hypothetical protein Enr8_48090 [Blastopirellula retiformator]|uniref:Uncharacterized protein n=1 Tax=Blastopirellula retiformator TaxID=2527970 RepID=A0A5C5UTB0_9BACT|nr:hypothetical protein Enr8_48090 [Blastopirellula retiformator]